MTALLFSAAGFAQTKNTTPANVPPILLSPKEFAAKMQTETGTLIDVRTTSEYKKGHLKSARLLDIFSDQFESEIDKLDKNATYYVYCAKGGRSGEATEMMSKKGFKKVYDMDGGFSKWSAEGLPVEQ